MATLECGLPYPFETDFQLSGHFVDNTSGKVSCDFSFENLLLVCEGLHNFDYIFVRGCRDTVGQPLKVKTVVVAAILIQGNDPPRGACMEKLMTVD